MTKDSQQEKSINKKATINVSVPRQRSRQRVSLIIHSRNLKVVSSILTRGTTFELIFFFFFLGNDQEIIKSQDDFITRRPSSRDKVMVSFTYVVSSWDDSFVLGRKPLPRKSCIYTG